MTVGVGPFSATTPIADGQTMGNFSETGKPPYANTIGLCDFDVVVQTAGTITVNARTGFFDWYGSADGTLSTNGPGIKVLPGNNCLD